MTADTSDTAILLALVFGIPWAMAIVVWVTTALGQGEGGSGWWDRWRDQRRKGGR